MGEVQKGKTNGDAPKKSIRDEIVPRLNRLIGGEFGKVMAEGLIVVDNEVGRIDAKTQAMEDNLGRLRADLMSAKGTASAANKTAEAATKDTMS